jgi:hypothetical protein
MNDSKSNANIPKSSWEIDDEYGFNLNGKATGYLQRKLESLCCFC